MALILNLPSVVQCNSMMESGRRINFSALQDSTFKGRYFDQHSDIKMSSLSVLTNGYVFNIALLSSEF